jgi:GT2 family glycosyltransferase
MKFCILIPTLNRKDLLLEALDYYTNVFTNISIYILDNGKQDIPNTYLNTYIYTKESNLGVSGSWNFLIEKAISNGYNYFLVLNDDIILKKDEESIYNIILKYGSDKFIRSEQFYNWSAFILSKSIYHRIGRFDTSFERCYFEDNDYEYRMKLENIPIVYDKELNAEVYRNSMTIQKEPHLNNFNNNLKYYESKWGGVPTEEKYTIPFNRNKEI